MSALTDAIAAREKRRRRKYSLTTSVTDQEDDFAAYVDVSNCDLDVLVRVVPTTLGLVVQVWGEDADAERPVRSIAVRWDQLEMGEE